jgi:hypothetical protein
MTVYLKQDSNYTTFVQFIGTSASLGTQAKMDSVRASVTAKVKTADLTAAKALIQAAADQAAGATITVAWQYVA